MKVCQETSDVFAKKQGVYPLINGSIGLFLHTIVRIIYIPFKPLFPLVIELLEPMASGKIIQDRQSSIWCSNASALSQFFNHILFSGSVENQDTPGKKHN